MSPEDLRRLTPGKTYRVRTKGGRTRTRIFKWLETRFGSILCGVFSTQIRGPITVEVVGPDHLRFSGAHVPQGEWSIPHYDIEWCEETSVAEHPLHSTFACLRIIQP